MARERRIGGLSGLAPIGDGRELLAVSDDRDHPRVFRLRISNKAGRLQVATAGVIYLQASPAAPSMLDPEAIAVTRDGHMLITSEGMGNEETRAPPAVIEYGSDGQFIRQFLVRPRYSPTSTGPMTSGARDNAGFESLTMASDFSRFFTGTELPLVQDGDDDSFKAGARSRLLEYVNTGSSFEPRREFAYEIEPLARPDFDVGRAVNGLVELLSLGGDALLSMERGFVESADRVRSMNRIRIFRIDLTGATDVSGIDSLRNAPHIVPVRKTLVVDVNGVPGLAPPLTQLDNFEGIAWGPKTTDGRRSLLIVSDDNFSESQVTGFLLLRVPASVGPNYN